MDWVIFALGWILVLWGVFTRFEKWVAFKMLIGIIFVVAGFFVSPVVQSFFGI